MIPPKFYEGSNCSTPLATEKDWQVHTMKKGRLKIRFVTAKTWFEARAIARVKFGMDIFVPNITEQDFQT